MKRMVFIAVVAWAASMASAQVSTTSKTTPLTQAEELICALEEGVVQCSKYTVSSLHTPWPWLNTLITQQLQQTLPALSAQRLPVPTPFDRERDWDMDRQYSVSEKSDYHGVVTLAFEGWDYGNGAAHGNPYVDYVVADTRSHTAITLDDLLLPQQQARVLAGLQQHNQPWLDERDMDAWPADMKLSHNISVDSKGVAFHYGVYELGPYILGLPTLQLTWSQIKPMLKPQWRQRF